MLVSMIPSVLEDDNSAAAESASDEVNIDE